jgi:hypothetical protein
LNSPRNRRKQLMTLVLRRKVCRILLGN